MAKGERYAKLFASTFRNRETRQLSHPAFRIYLGAIGHDACHLTGIYEMDLPGLFHWAPVSEPEGWAAMPELVPRFLDYCDGHSLLWVRGKAKRELTGSPKLIAGVLNELALLPACRLLMAFAEKYPSLRFDPGEHEPSTCIPYGYPIDNQDKPQQTNVQDMRRAAARPTLQLAGAEGDQAGPVAPPGGRVPSVRDRGTGQGEPGPGPRAKVPRAEQGARNQGHQGALGSAPAPKAPTPGGPGPTAPKTRRRREKAHQPPNDRQGTLVDGGIGEVALRRSPQPRKPRTTKRSPPDPRIRQFLDHAVASHLERRGSPLVIARGKHAKRVKDWLAVTDLESLKAAWLIYIKLPARSPIVSWIANGRNMDAFGTVLTGLLEMSAADIEPRDEFGYKVLTYCYRHLDGTGQHDIEKCRYDEHPDPFRQGKIEVS